MLLKLYKQIGEKILYWETWDNEGVYTVHWGKLGDIGDTKEVKNSLFKRASSIVRVEEKEMRTEGYREFEDLKTIFIQYKIDGFGGKSDLDKRYKIEGIMNESLGWTGLGHCDGGDIGSNTMNIFCLVVDAKLATEIIVNTLKDKGYDNGALIIEETEENLNLLWPNDFEGEIGY